MFTMVDKSGIIDFEYLDKKYSMTAEEIEAAFRYQEWQYRLQDAKEHLNFLVFGDDSCGNDDFGNPEKFIEEKAAFLQKYGLPYEEAYSPEMLECYTQAYEEYVDCNIAENETWEVVIEKVLSEVRA